MKTKDYGLASLMLCKNKKMINHVRDEYGRYWFEFEDDKQRENDLLIPFVTVILPQGAFKSANIFKCFICLR